jgi:two-component system, NtrC family, sensor kinase
MSFWKHIKPEFWDHRDVASGRHRHLFNLRRIWYLSVLLTAGVSLMPVFFLAAIDYQVTQKAIESENMLRTSRLVSNARRTLSFFLLERKYALEFLVRDNSYEQLIDNERLNTILANLHDSFGGFTDIGVIDIHGRQIAYSGPFDLVDRDYSRQSWFEEVMEQGSYVSDIFMGYRRSPHLVIAVKHTSPDGRVLVLRVDLEAEKFHSELIDIEIRHGGEMFIINQDGILQTPTRRLGYMFEKMILPVPPFSESTQVFETRDPEGEELVVGYAYLEGTPFILMVAKTKSNLMQPWLKARQQILVYLVVSVMVILIAVLVVATYLVSKIHTADQTRVAALHKVEYVNKMASIGRLAAGVAHEINNPLAIINEKAGLMKDLMAQQEPSPLQVKMQGLLDSILSSVNRCATITRRLLSFARQSDVTFDLVDIRNVIENVIGFLGKESEYRNISIDVDIAPDIPFFKSDRGKLEQIFLNLMNNAFSALSDGGHLQVIGRKKSEKDLNISVIDDGCGIHPDDIKRVFEPFFSTRTQQGGTGLGLSITHGLVQELGGTITVESQLGKGTRFNITLPLRGDAAKVERNETDSRIAG